MSLMKFLAAACALLATLPCRADDGKDLDLSISTELMTRQTSYGNSSRLQPSVDMQYRTRFGALYIQDGEGGWALPAPAGWVSLGVASEPIWSLGGGVSQSMGVARYGFDLPKDGSLSFGYADRIGDQHPGHLLVASLDAPLFDWRGQKFSLLGWASLANQTRRLSLGHSDDGAGWQLEQSNLLLVMSHPLGQRWTLDVGAGSRWAAENTGSHTAGWQTLLGFTWKL
ncbi:hypothetical protein [Chromobacterium sphagni]|uniref:Transporter n=1 Tax=Chromobacterium sphagni TaxID=1903179 RepID=A0A1S1WZ00_9NEIS|nr:hypothetical protein [Chromobacterium sphagni]OHX12502.1 hypothetical protein BI347_02535 [Chromobacterium sphagni]OHX21413.1 hypothetical protein BI344_02465 [Chromobacterium sphagni]